MGETSPFAIPEGLRRVARREPESRPWPSAAVLRAAIAGLTKVKILPIDREWPDSGDGARDWARLRRLEKPHHEWGVYHPE